METPYNGRNNSVIDLFNNIRTMDLPIKPEFSSNVKNALPNVSS
jgi:hypothetical protein